MEIKDRLFSENNPEEKYYSVLMDETEYALYSEFQKEFGAVDLAKKTWNSLKTSGVRQTAGKVYGKVKQAAANYYNKAKGMFKGSGTAGVTTPVA